MSKRAVGKQVQVVGTAKGNGCRGAARKKASAAEWSRRMNARSANTITPTDKENSR